MTRTDSSLCFVISFFVVIVLCNGSSIVDATRVMDKRTLLQAPPLPRWCVAKDGLSEAILQGVIDRLCGPLQVPCNQISLGFNCWYPDTRYAHAAWALNYYASSMPGGSCLTEVAKVVYKDPSYGSCTYAPCTTCN